VAKELERVYPERVKYNEDKDEFEVLEEYEEYYDLEKGFIFYDGEKIYYQSY